LTSGGFRIVSDTLVLFAKIKLCCPIVVLFTLFVIVDTNTSLQELINYTTTDAEFMAAAKLQMLKGPFIVTNWVIIINRPHKCASSVVTGC